MEETEKRVTVVAGQFYPGSADELTSIIEEMIPANDVKEKALAVIVPHAGYIYSGPVVGATLSRIEIPDTVIIIGPSHTGFGKPISTMIEGVWETPLGDIPVDTVLAKELLRECDCLEDDRRALNFEHSIEVQLPFLKYLKPDVRIVPIVVGHTQVDRYRELGQSIARVLQKTGSDALIMVSSDMNHYEPQSVTHDKDMLAVDAVLALDEAELISKVKEEAITMCGVAAAVSMLVAVKERGAVNAELVMYRTSGDETLEYDAVVGYAGIIISGPSPLVQLAKDAVEAYITRGEVIDAPELLISPLKERAGVFVSIHKKGALRGCIGTFDPSEENVAREIIMNALSSSTRDPRFMSVDPEELDLLDYSVDVLTAPELVDSEEDLDPKKYGVIVEAGYNRGLLLPDLEGVDTVEQQVAISREKAGIPESQPVKLYRFEVKRYK